MKLAGDTVKVYDVIAYQPFQSDLAQQVVSRDHVP
jgi:hypothetical protein